MRLLEILRGGNDARWAHVGRLPRGDVERKRGSVQSLALEEWEVAAYCQQYVGGRNARGSKRRCMVTCYG